MTFQRKQTEKEADEQKQKLLRSEQSLQATQNKEQELRKKMEVTIQVEIFFFLCLLLYFFRLYVCSTNHFLAPAFFLLTGVAEGEEQCNGPVGPEQQASDSAGRGEKERRPESEAHTGISRRPQE